MELSVEWYKRALALVYASAGGAIETQVVTNDPGWCRKHLDLGRSYRVLPTGSALEDMQCLTASDFLVISRSTFSWWAAAISDATVVAPDPRTPDMVRRFTQSEQAANTAALAEPNCIAAGQRLAG